MAGGRTDDLLERLIELRQQQEKVERQIQDVLAQFTRQTNALRERTDRAWKQR